MRAGDYVKLLLMFFFHKVSCFAHVIFSILLPYNSIYICINLHILVSFTLFYYVFTFVLVNKSMCFFSKKKIRVCVYLKDMALVPTRAVLYV